jgi:hypothetical protein
MPKQMKKLAASQERAIMAALADVASHVKEGGEPNASLIKAAEAHSIPAGHINLMVHAYNTAGSDRQRDGGSSVLEKAADFPLASASAVLEALYPAAVKTAAAAHHDAAVDPMYSAPPTWTDDVQLQEKAAAAATIDWSMGPKPAPLPREAGDAMKRAWSSVTANKREFEHARRELAESENAVVAALEKAGAYFRHPGSLPFGSAQAAVELYHGDTGRAVMTQVLRSRPDLAKQAGAAPPIVDWKAAPFSLLLDCATKGQDMLRKRASLAAAETEHEKTAEATLRPFASSRSLSCLAGLYSPVKAAGVKKAAGLGTVLGYDAAKKAIGGVAGNMTTADGDATVNDTLHDIASPDHETRLRDIELQYTLQDMMANDPVIGQHDPEAVTNAFNELSQTAPNVAQQPLQMRALLRKHLQQSAFDPFEAQQVADMEKTVSGFRTADSGANNGTSVLTG